MRIILYISLFILSLTSIRGFSQTPNYAIKAYELFQSKDFEQAKVYIDSAEQANQLKDSRTLLLKGMIYRKLDNTINSKYRTIALDAFQKAKSLNSNQQVQKQANLSIYNTIILTYNESFLLLIEGKLNKSEARYLKYKEQYLKYYDATFNFDETDISYFNALGSAWQTNNSLADRNEQLRMLDLAVEKFQKSLAIDKNNYDSNYGIGSAYFNQGADLIMNIDPTSSINLADTIQNISLRLFKNGLPYLLKAHELEPENEEVIRGLMQIYHSLHNEIKEKYYNALLELPKLLKAHQANPKDKGVLEDLIKVYKNLGLKEKEKYYTDLLKTL